MAKILSIRLPQQPATRQRALVLREVQDPYAKYVTCYEDLESNLKDRFAQGNYFPTLEEALANFQERCQQEFNHCEGIMNCYWQRQQGEEIMSSS
jgi:hypothetical protein